MTPQSRQGWVDPTAVEAAQAQARREHVEGLSGEHQCDWCPIDVRDLYAAAHNTHGAVTRYLQGQGDYHRALRKLAELGAALDEYKPKVDAHFEAKHRG